MKTAIRSNDLPLNLLCATPAVPIPSDHPAYTQPALPSHAARRRSAAATIAGLLLVATLSSGIAHYLIETAAPASEDATTSLAVTATIPTPQPMMLAAEPPATSLALPATQGSEPSSALPAEAAPSTVVVPSVDAKPLSRPRVSAMSSASLARKNAARKEAARKEIERRQVAALPSSPPADDALLLAANPPADPVTPMQGADNTNRR